MLRIPSLAAALLLGLASVPGPILAAIELVTIQEFASPQVLDFESESNGPVATTSPIFTDFGLASITAAAPPSPPPDSVQAGAPFYRALFYSQALGLFLSTGGGAEPFFDSGPVFTISLVEEALLFGVAPVDTNGDIRITFRNGGLEVGTLNFIGDRSSTYYFRSDVPFDEVVLDRPGHVDGFGVDNITLDYEVPEIRYRANFLHERTDASGQPDGLSRINHPASNADPAALLFLTQLSGCSPSSPCLSAVPMGVWYDDLGAKWSVFPAPSSTDPIRQHILLAAPNGQALLHVSDVTNTAGSSTFLDHPATNGAAQARLIVTRNAGNAPPLEAGEHPFGVWYDDAASQWAIFNEGGAAMPLGRGFNVLVAPDDGTSSAHVVTTMNTSASRSMIDDPFLNGRPDALFQLTHNLNPAGGPTGVPVDHPVTTLYNAGYWHIAWDGFVDPIGASFNYHVPYAPSFSLQHAANASNIVGEATLVAAEETDGAAALILFETANRDVIQDQGVPNPSPVGIAYDSSLELWTLFDQDLAPYPSGSASNLHQPPIDARTFIHVADSGGSHISPLGHPHTLGDPGALLFVSQLRDAVAGPAAYNDHPVAVQYTGSDWSVLNLDLQPLPIGVLFNIHVAPPGSGAFMHVADSGDTSGARTTLDHVDLNDDPTALLLVTQQAQPGAYDDRSVFVDYDEISGRWSIENQDGAAMPLGAAFNVIRVPEPSLPVMWMAGLGFLIGVGRRRAKRAQPRAGAG